MSTSASDTMNAPPAQGFYLTREHHPENGTMLGFWIYLMSDCLVFAVLFAMYAVLGRNYAAGPGPRALFELPTVLLNTSMLLLSSITYGFAMIWHIWWMAAGSFAALIGAAIIHTFNYHRDFHIPADEVAKVEGERSRLLAQQV